MAFASRSTADLVTLAQTYGAHEHRSLGSVAGLAIGKGGFFERLSYGGDCTTGTAERVLDWFATHWPRDLVWPATISRPNGRASFVPDQVPEAMEASEAAFLASLTHLDIWVNGRRPAWWFDLEVRAFLTRTHRQMSVVRAAAQGAERFGVRCPKKSAIHEYWMRLDKVTPLSPMPPQPKPKKEAA